MPINILSLFDGISCGQIALNNIGITDYNYFASEIDKFAIQVAQANFPNTIKIGDVTKIDGKIIKDITLLCGGSPCQGFSFAGKQLNFEDERSKLFFEYVRILKEVKPKYFLLENVKMKKEYQDVISESLFGIQPILINSAKLTAQNRNRLYWVGEKQEDGTYKQVEIEQPEDKGILLKDILEDEVDEKYNISEKHTEAMIRSRSSGKLNLPDIEGKCGTLIASYYKIPQDGPYIGQKNVRIDEFSSFNQDNVFCGKDDKVPTLTAGDGGLRPKTYSCNKIRKLTPLECERLQGIPDGYTGSLSNSQRYKTIGNGWTIPVIEHILKHIFNKKYL